MTCGRRSGRYGDLIKTPIVQLPTAARIMTETTMRLVFLVKILPLEALTKSSLLNSLGLPLAKMSLKTRHETRPPIKAANMLSKANPETRVMKQIREKFKRIICLLRVRISLFLNKVFMSFSPLFSISNDREKVNIMGKFEASKEIKGDLNGNI